MSFIPDPALSVRYPLAAAGQALTLLADVTRFQVISGEIVVRFSDVALGATAATTTDLHLTSLLLSQN